MAAIQVFSSSSSSTANFGSDNSMSPTRISFSHDFSHSSAIPVEPHALPSTSVDFDFCVRGSFDERDSSSADELFSHGRIIPAQIKSKKTNKYNHPPLKQHSDQSLLLAPPQRPQGVRENASTTIKTPSKKEADNNNNQNHQKSFWGFRRSSSCGSGYGRSLCPLPLLSRSHSTGSTSASSSGGRRNKNNNAQKLHASRSSSSSPPPPHRRLLLLLSSIHLVQTLIRSLH